MTGRGVQGQATTPSFSTAGSSIPKRPSPLVRWRARSLIPVSDFRVPGWFGTPPLHDPQFITAHSTFDATVRWNVKEWIDDLGEDYF